MHTLPFPPKWMPRCKRKKNRLQWALCRIFYLGQTGFLTQDSPYWPSKREHVLWNGFARYHHSVLAIRVQLSAFLVLFFHVPDNICVYRSVACACKCKKAKSCLLMCVDVTMIHITYTHIYTHITHTLIPQTAVGFQFDTYSANNIFPWCAYSCCGVYDRQSKQHAQML